MKKVFLVILCLLVILSLKAQTAASFFLMEVGNGENYLIEDNRRFSELKKPVVAIALGGGGARALVNIGVLKALEEEEIPIDMVLGTSMGAIVAVLYGSGLSISEIEDIVTDEALLSLFDLNFPFYKSLLTIEKLNYILEELTPNKQLEDFSVPTALLSYDLKRGVRYVHTTGRVSEVVQGSFAIPFVFPVPEYKDSYLVDPGILELTPARTARLLEADIVISTTAYDELPYNTYGLPHQALIQYISLIKEENSQKIVDEYSDVVISHDVGDYSMMDFHLAEWFIKLGYERTKEELPKIKNLLKENGIQFREKEKLTGKNDYIYKVLSDIRNGRQVMRYTNIQPLFYYGKDMDIFNQSIFRKSLLTAQYGLKLEKNHYSFFVLTEGKIDNRLQLKGRIKKLTEQYDLIGLFEKSSNDYKYDLSLYHYKDNSVFAGGLASINQDYFISLKKKYQKEIQGGKLQGSGEFLVPLNRNGQKNTTEYLLAGELEYPLSTTWIVNPKILIGDTRFLHYPELYRGVKTSEQSNNRLQASLELKYEYNFQYSRELFQILQMTGIEEYQFFDIQGGSNTTYALGAGLSLKLRVMGIKPLTLGSSVAYDFSLDSLQTRLDLNISF